MPPAHCASYVSLEVYCSQFRCDIAYTRSVPDVIAQQEAMAVCALDKRRPLHGYRARNERRTHDAVVFVKKHAGEELKMGTGKIANRRQLPGAVVSRDPAALNLIADSIRADSVDVGA